MVRIWSYAAPSQCPGELGGTYRLEVGGRRPEVEGRRPEDVVLRRVGEALRQVRHPDTMTAGGNARWTTGSASGSSQERTSAAK